LRKLKKMKVLRQLWGQYTVNEMHK